MRVVIFGLGYTGAALAQALLSLGHHVTGITRANFYAPESFDKIIIASHIISTVPPAEDGDAVLAHFATALTASAANWIGYYSTTGVYGDRQGATVDESTPPAPGQPRSIRRLAAETAWREMAAGRPLDICRIAGIYGPGRSVFDDLSTGKARRITRPKHFFGRIHIDDIVNLTIAAMHSAPTGTRILHFTDHRPAEPAEVTAYAAKLLEIDAPPLIPYEEAQKAMSPLAQSFWAESRIVANAKTLETLKTTLLYPSFREGLAAILAQNPPHDLA